MHIKKRKVITVLNEKGLRNIDAIEYYSNSTKIVSIKAEIYNAFGTEIKKIRRSDFIDQSVADGFSIYTDDRVLSLRYVPTEYPFTIVYESEINTSNTAFVPSWYPFDDYNESVEKTSFHINFPSDLGFRYKEINFDKCSISKSNSDVNLSYTIENLVAEKEEEYAVSFEKSIPHVMFGLTRFNLEGVKGTAVTWKDFGLWVYQKLLVDRDELSIETQSKIKELVGLETDPIKKARIIYEYMQNKTRYVSIQLGIGGWKPMLANDVDRLGYGDCKALSNYTKALLNVVGVNSYYAIIYGGNDQTDLKEDFVSMQGNHAVLAIPVKEKYVFLECTSQTQAFGFEGDFTDDRFALVVKPEGGELIRTNSYIDKGNSQLTFGKIILGDDGGIKITTLIKSKGIQYDSSYHIENSSDDEIKKHYKSRLSNINNLKIESYKFTNNKKEVEFIEELKLSTDSYGKLTGNEMMIPLNILNQSQNIPQRYRNRKHDFEISRGFYDEDSIEVELPQNYKLIAQPNSFELVTKFGNYQIESKVEGDNKIIYKRRLLINKGIYDKAEYEEFRKFKEQIAKNDNSKILIQKI